MILRYRFLSFARNMGKNIGKNITKNSSGNYNKRSLDHARQSTTDALKIPLLRVLQITVEATDDLIGNKIEDEITGTAAESTPETVPSKTGDTEFDAKKSIEIPKIYHLRKHNTLLMDLN